MKFSDWLKEYLLYNELPGASAQQLMSRHLYRPSVEEAPINARKSGVLLCLQEIEENTYSIVLIQRTIDKSAHSGQIAFPGGRYEDDDLTLTHTAIREAQEEIGIDINELTILGSITPLYIPVSNYSVYPVVALYNNIIDDSKKSVNEVASILNTPLDILFNSKEPRTITIDNPVNMDIEVMSYIINNELIVWGATAMILSELEALYRIYMKEVIKY